MIELLLLFFLFYCYSEKIDLKKNRLDVVKDKLNNVIDSTTAYLLLNNDKMIGSYGRKKLINGKVIHLPTEEEIQIWKKSNDYNGILVVPDHLLDSTHLNLFEQLKVQGVVFYDSNSTHYVSQDYRSSFNPNASEVAWKKYTYPIMFTPTSIVYFTQNNGYLQIEDEMLADGDSEICLRRGMCQPIGGQSLVGRLVENHLSESILLSAQLDGVSIFRDATPAHEQIVSGEATLLSVLETLRPLMKGAKKGIDFGFFEGETFGNMGSKTFSKSNDSYSHIIHFGPLGLTEGSLFVYSKDQVPQDIHKRIVNKTNEYPHCALSSFKNGIKMYLSDHEELYKGNIGTHQDYLPYITELCDNIESITQIILQIIFNRSDIETLQKELEIQYDCEKYHRLYHCLAYDLSCDYFNETIGIIQGNSNSYSSIYRETKITPRSKAIHDYLNRIVTMGVCKEECDTSIKNGTVTYLGSYGSDIDISKNKVVGSSGDAWTESNWKQVKLTFYQPRTFGDVTLITLGVGLTLMTIIAFFTVIFKLNLL
ncbi:hypothetical protein EHI8A_069390 [Entamoeba histolytica HM-1:IMSS-B]|uniref:Nicastrin n=4 Tax=Entamoeba histolytica TaxID=5759 RepID=C4LVX3_ENTH1|nr:hypothetical protein EHI_125870 [Entamoeba histolytica HM-1:IMSS]EAL51106.1 hypothetical protein EHI_125870 [Entamoeba histolytica HM-1:IMSS]EMH76950.1 hypothetical protein EHI8A_069390 [Entamoeba histolytica HM-1:IMSS-B]ENY61167.1 hypothetical protein EHI7A_066510 [Entamoeba histolytica HM-1:IMSS-A]GAT92831.1 hypothetical protein CL6EHI_125870 [Entamoeba histolytica]|eukprot:XP_656491.1 hypothetical protein EHI_125870 [Entamoeba histolytica HM-1:IMSS]